MSESVDLKKVESLYQTLRKAEWQMTIPVNSMINRWLIVL